MLRPSSKFEVFFDGQCPLCKREIDFVRKKDKRGQLLFTDISSALFVPTDRSLNLLMREIHGRLPDGSYVTGVEVFRQIYQRVGYEKFVLPTRLPIIRQCLDLGYRLFAFLRFKHAMHRIKKSKCSIDGSKVAGGGATSCEMIRPRPLNPPGEIKGRAGS